MVPIIKTICKAADVLWSHCDKVKLRLTEDAKSAYSFDYIRIAHYPPNTAVVQCIMPWCAFEAIVPFQYKDVAEVLYVTKDDVSAIVNCKSKNWYDPPLIEEGKLWYAQDCFVPVMKDVKYGSLSECRDRFNAGFTTGARVDISLHWLLLAKSIFGASNKGHVHMYVSNDGSILKFEQRHSPIILYIAGLSRED